MYLVSNDINLDTVCVYSDKEGYETLTTLELGTKHLYYICVNHSAIFAIRESRINDNGYEET